MAEIIPAVDTGRSISHENIYQYMHECIYENLKTLIGFDAVDAFKGCPGDAGAAPPRRLQVWPSFDGAV